jgi:two-component system, cell cycle response regulator DivK
MDSKPLALLIEDDRDVSELFRHVLDMAGYQSENIYDGVEAMKRLAVTQPDVVLLDLQLPGISGVEILKKMRADERLMTIPVIVITAYAYYAKNLPIQPDLFLLKPVDIHDLSNVMQRLRDKKDSLREPPYDKVTHLFSESFFSVRLIFAMERVKRMELERFGVLFADLHPFKGLQENLSEEILNALLRKMADHFKGLLGPEDTLAWSKEGYFLSLFEEVGGETSPVMTAKRVSQSLNDFIKLHELEDELGIQVGVIMCDNGYDGAQEILDDIQFARSFVKSQPDAGHWVYTRNELRQMRNTQS